MHHKIDYCCHCEREVVLCGTCGNNTCNGGYGEVMGPEPDTTMPCPDCPDAYEFDKARRVWKQTATLNLGELLSLSETAPPTVEALGK